MWDNKRSIAESIWMVATISPKCLCNWGPSKLQKTVEGPQKAVKHPRSDHASLFYGWFGAFGT